LLDPVAKIAQAVISLYGGFLKLQKIKRENNNIDCYFQTVLQIESQEERLPYVNTVKKKIGNNYHCGLEGYNNLVQSKRTKNE
jgi:hypothetical protein